MKGTSSKQKAAKVDQSHRKKAGTRNSSGLSKNGHDGQSKIRASGKVPKTNTSTQPFFRVKIEDKVFKVPKNTLSQVLTYLKSIGNQVILKPSIKQATDFISTQDAAELLNVSRPFVVKLIDENQIPAIKVGKHRRLLRKDVLAYSKDMRTGQQIGLKELAAEAQKLGLGY